MHTTNPNIKVFLVGLRCIEEGGTRTKAVVCDGHVGLLQAVTSCPVQMCQFHQLQIVRRLLYEYSGPVLIYDYWRPVGMELLGTVEGIEQIARV